MNDPKRPYYYPPYQRHSATSKAAAKEIKNKRVTIRQEILRTIAKSPNGLTDTEIQDMLGIDGSTQRPRRIELERMGLIVSNGTRLTRSNRHANIWVAVNNS